MATSDPTPRIGSPTLPTLIARDIVGPDGRAAIWLDETLYILRITRSGKLILTK